MQESAGIDTKKSKPITGFVVPPGTIVSNEAIARAQEVIPGFTLTDNTIPTTNVVPDWLREGHDLIAYQSLTNATDTGQFVWETRRGNDLQTLESISGQRVKGRLVTQN